MARVNGLLLGAALSAAILAPQTTRAAECAAQQVLASVAMTMQQNGVPLVPVSLVATPKHFIVATGGYLSQVFPATARELNLPRRDVALGVVGANGLTSNTAVQVSQFEIGGLRTQNVRLMVAPGRDTGDIPEGAAAGGLGPDVLQNYDVDLDFAERKFS